MPAGSADADALIERCKAQAQDRIDALLAAWARQLDTTLPRDRQVINWAEAQEMSAAGVSFGSHSATHRILTHLDRAEARKEIEEMGGRKVFLELRVKVLKDWRNDENALRRLGYKMDKKRK